MQAWEYCRLYPQRALLRRFTAQGAVDEQLEDVGRAVYRLGQEGWEIAGVEGWSQPGDGDQYVVREVLTFKRPVVVSGSSTSEA